MELHNGNPALEGKKRRDANTQKFVFPEPAHSDDLNHNQEHGSTEYDDGPAQLQISYQFAHSQDAQ